MRHYVRLGKRMEEMGTEKMEMSHAWCCTLTIPATQEWYFGELFSNCNFLKGSEYSSVFLGFNPWYPTKQTKLYKNPEISAKNLESIINII